MDVDLKPNKIYTAAYISSTALALSSLAAGYFYLRNSGQVIVIHFNAFRGIDFLGTRAHVLGIGFIALFINLLNVALSKFLQSRDKFLSAALATANLALMILALAAVVTIVVNNG